MSHEQGGEGDHEDPELTKFCEALWAADENRLKPEVHYHIDLQGRTSYSLDGPDRAANPLFAKVDPAVFQRPTFKTFIALLDNYESATGVPETVTKQEEQENIAFINEICKSKPIHLCHQFLKSKGKVSADLNAFKKELYNMWFKLYRRSRESKDCDSSGFEHVFVGETRGDKEVLGFHNWIQFYLQEKLGNVDYKGYMPGGKNPHLLTIQFSWRGDVKPKGSTMVGVSPEFEVALYTVLHLLGHSSYRITLDGDEVIVKAHKLAGKIGSCYPQVQSWNRRK